MAVLGVCGLQWGDEGKAKVIDYIFNSGYRDPLSETDFRNPKVVARYQGGANAGHTIVTPAGIKIISHQIPSGITRQGVYNLSLPGVVLEPKRLVDEIRDFEKNGYPVTPDNFGIDGRASVTLLFHRTEDGWKGGRFGENRLGTTGNGIGPTYADRALRTGVTFAEFLDEDAFAEALRNNQEETGRKFDIAAYLDDYREARHALRPFLVDSCPMLIGSTSEPWILEGAQAVMLDVEWGSYPWTTASHPSRPPLSTDFRIGIAKAYTTRVGEGPFPTELGGETGDFLRERGGEYGATTGRPRRCGWLDANLLNYAVRVNQANGFSSIALTKLDVLSGLKEIKVCVDYKDPTGNLVSIPMKRGDWKRVVPIYETFEGWSQDISGVRRFEDLPIQAQHYVRQIQFRADEPISLISVGPKAEQTFAIQI